LALCEKKNENIQKCNKFATKYNYFMAMALSLLFRWVRLVEMLL